MLGQKQETNFGRRLIEHTLGEQISKIYFKFLWEAIEKVAHPYIHNYEALSFKTY